MSISTKKLVMFDLDGTLLDTSFDLTYAMNIMLKEYGLNEITKAQTEKFIGFGAKEFVRRAVNSVGGEYKDEYLSRYKVIYDANSTRQTRIYNGIDDLLKSLKNNGILLAIMSNKPQSGTDAVCEKYLKEYGFDYIYGNREGYPHKPDKAVGEIILSALKVEKENCIMVGDGETDVEFAANLGIDGIAVLWGFRSKAQLKEAGASEFAETAEELKTKINKKFQL